MEKTTLAVVLKKISGTFQQSPHLTTNADKVCSVRHIKLSDIGIIEMCTVCPCHLDECKLHCAICKHLCWMFLLGTSVCSAQMPSSTDTYNWRQLSTIKKIKATTDTPHLTASHKQHQVHSWGNSYHTPYFGLK